MDLGTIYYSPVICEDGEVRPIERQTSQSTTPSRVSSDDDGISSAGSSAAKDNSNYDEPAPASIVNNHLDKSLNGKTILVFDLGGGTFDVSILKIKGSELKVLGVGGDTHLGGEVFDNALVEYCLEEFKKSVGVDLKADMSSVDYLRRRNATNKIRRLKQQCEKIKIALSTKEQMHVSIDAIHNAKFHVVITREKFESLNKAHFDKCFDILKKVLEGSNIDVQNVDDVILLGCSSKIPAIQTRVTDFFGGKKSHCNIRGSEFEEFEVPIEVKSTSPYKNMSQVKDLCPPSVGAEIERTYNFTPILKQNTPVPWSNTRDLRILENNRKEEKNDVFDGGNQFMERNPFLGGFKLALPANAPHGEIIEITMELTSEGIKHYIAICPRKGSSNSFHVIESNGRQLTTAHT